MIILKTKLLYGKVTIFTLVVTATEKLLLLLALLLQFAVFQHKLSQKCNRYNQGSRVVLCPGYVMLKGDSKAGTTTIKWSVTIETSGAMQYVVFFVVGFASKEEIVVQEPASYLLANR